MFHRFFSRLKRTGARFVEQRNRRNYRLIADLAVNGTRGRPTKVPLGLVRDEEAFARSVENALDLVEIRNALSQTTVECDDMLRGDAVGLRGQSHQGAVNGANRHNRGRLVMSKDEVDSNSDFELDIAGRLQFLTRGLQESNRRTCVVNVLMVCGFALLLGVFAFVLWDARSGVGASPGSPVAGVTDQAAQVAQCMPDEPVRYVLLPHSWCHSLTPGTPVSSSVFLDQFISSLDAGQQWTLYQKLLVESGLELEIDGRPGKITTAATRALAEKRGSVLDEEQTNTAAMHIPSRKLMELVLGSDFAVTSVEGLASIQVIDASTDGAPPVASTEHEDSLSTASPDSDL